MLFRRVFASTLDPGKRWYALTTEICGGPTKKFANSAFTERFDGEIRKVRLDCLRTDIGAKCQAKWFDGGRMKDEVYASTAFGIIGGLLRLKDLKTRRDQVLIGLVPMNNIYCKAQTNCKEQRKEIETLVRKLNIQKNFLKENGITVDGKKYKLKFTVTADYKALCLLMKKKDDDDDNFKIGGKGVNVECCIYCLAIRGCACKNTEQDDACIGCLKYCFNRSKANIG
ncbi:hypothetical protein QZH41_017778, partial [Actinostola sp. cb2023]